MHYKACKRTKQAQEGKDSMLSTALPPVSNTHSKVSFRGHAMQECCDGMGLVWPGLVRDTQLRATEPRLQ